MSRCRVSDNPLESSLRVAPQRPRHLAAGDEAASSRPAGGEGSSAPARAQQGPTAL